MRALLVGDDANSTEALASKLSELPRDVATKLELSVMSLEREQFSSGNWEAEIVILDATVEDAAAQLARVTKRRNPNCTVLVFVPHSSFENGVASLNQSYIQRVFSENATSAELAVELLSIYSGRIVPENEDSRTPSVIAGKYFVEKCLGMGTLGAVYRCANRELGTVAVKVLFPEIAKNEVAAVRFQNEFKASCGVTHPNVVRAYEYISEGSLIAYAMEFIGGGDLADRFNRERRFPFADIYKLLIQICSGLQAIHESGIVHRDLKPENILLTDQGDVKIADFGIARLSEGPKLTAHGEIMGTIGYVSPEYLLQSKLDNRSDIYALGVMAYEMVTGRPPFQEATMYATLKKRLNSDPKKPSAHRWMCPRALNNIILKAMARNPAERYQSAAEMLEALKQA
jgi:predicted Ser/Thr protein kinase